MQFIFSNRTIFYWVFLFGLFISLILPAYNLFLTLGLLIIFTYLISGKKILIFLIVVSFLTIPRELGGNFRTALQYLNILFLFYLFIKEYGIDFNSFPKLPRLVVDLLLLFFTSLIIATVFSDYKALGIHEIIRTVVFFIIIFFIYSLLKDNNDIRILLLALFISGLYFSFALLYAFYKNDFFLLQERIKNDFTSHNGWTAYIMIIFSIAFSFYLGLRRKKYNIIFPILFIIFLFSIFVTDSRGAMLAFVISTFFLLYNINKKIFKYSLFLILFIIPILFVNPISQFIDLYFRLDKVSTGRDVIWSIIYKIISANPLFGVGPAATKYYLFPNLTCMLGSPAANLITFHYNEIEYGHAHNFYLFFWSDLGFLGLITSVFLPFSFFKLGFKNLNRLKRHNKEYYYLTLGILAGGLGMFVRGIYEWSGLISYGTISTDMPFWIIFIILWYINFKKIKKEDKILI